MLKRLAKLAASPLAAGLMLVAAGARRAARALAGEPPPAAGASGLESSVIDALPISVAMRDLECRFVQVNRTWESYFGIRREDAVGRRFCELPGWRDNPELAQVARDAEQLDRDVFARGAAAPPVMFEDTRLGRSYLLGRQLYTDARGRVAGILATGVDISELKRAEAALRESESRYDLAMRAVNEGIYDWNVAEGTIFFSDSVYTVLGAPRSMKTPQDWSGRIHPEDLARYHAAIVAHFKGETERFECDYRYRAADESWRWARQQGIAVRDERGRAVRMIGATGDVTALKLAELELAERARFVSGLVDALPISIAMRDTEGRYVLVNRAWERYFGVGREDALGKRRREFPGWQRRLADADEIERIDREMLAQGADHVEEPREQERLGRSYLMTRRVLADSAGKPIGVLSAGLDNTERRAQDEALRNQVKFINDLVEALPISLAMRDVEGRYVRVNRAWERYFGLRREDVLGRRRRDFAGAQDDPVLAADSERIEALDRELLGRGPDYIPEARELVRRGRSFLITSRALFDSAGKPIGILSAGVDTTEQRAVAEALATEQRRLDLVVRGARVGIVDWDGHSHATYYSPIFREMLGHAPDADTSAWPDYFKVLIHPEDRERIIGRWRAFIIGRGPEGPRGEYYAPEEYRLQKKDGSYLWVQSSGIAVRDDKGFVTRWIAAISDVTQRRSQDEALRIEQRRLDLVVRGARVGIVDWDGRTHATYYSPIFREILGHAPDADTSGWPDYFKALVHPEDREGFTRRWQAFIRGQGPEGPRGEFLAPQEHRLLRKDGSYVWVQVSGVAVRDEKGFVTRWIGATTDISERRAQEEALRASVRLREEVERMSRHDLKTPLNSVIAMSRLLRENSQLSPEDADLLGTIERAGYRILNMVNLSLDLFRMESGTYQFQPRTVDLAQVAGKVAADLESQAASKNVDIRVRARGASAASNPVMARADELLCYSMFANLVKNAIEAAPEGSAVAIGLRNDGASALAEVHNAGAVPEAMRARFFEKYATAGKSAGLGLGTYSARLMARVQGGELTLRSSEAEGTTLTVRLAAARGAEAAAASAAPEAGAARERERESLPQLHVLVVDDDEFNRLVLRRYLPTPPFTLSLAVNGRAALEAAERRWPDVVLLDLEMPVMDGYQAARALREMERAAGRPRLTIVAISSNDEQAIVSRALAAGCDRYLTKPAPRALLWDLLRGIGAPGREAAAAAEEAEGLPQFAEADAVLLDADLEDTLSGFLDTRRAMLDAMPRALAAANRAEFRRLAHKLAGSFALYGFGWAAVQCRALEHDAQGGAIAELEARAARVRRHLDGVTVRFKPAQGRGEGA